jgi:tRNA A-37 threonylcarbamoyl transferase component Bud32/tetratricopeptide (TPR) repeat protein
MSRRGHALNKGDILAGRFEIEGTAGAGGMAMVYRARERDTGRTVAIKVLRNATTLDEQRLQREAEVLAQLQHPAIVQYLDRGRTERAEPFVVMEWLEGETLAAHLAREARLTLSESLDLVRGVAEALSAAHGRGIVHRDIKPSNIFLLPEQTGGTLGAVRVLDFGLARPGHSSSRMTQTGAIVGTLGYMAPEQAAGGGEIDARADVFSLGCVFYECLTGQPAFADDSIPGVLAQILFEDVARVRTLRPEIPAVVDDLVARMLARDPAGRPCDAAQVLHELAQMSLATDLATLPLGPAEVITAREMRLMCLIAMRPPAPGTQLPYERLGEGVAPFGTQLERLPDGTLVVALLGRGSATDLAARAARCALSMHRILPTARVGLATVQAEVGGRVSLGEAVTQAMVLVTPSSDADGDAEGGREREGGAALEAGPAEEERHPVRIDAVTRGLLDARFAVAEEAEGGAALLGEVRGDWETPRRLLGRPTPCVGRDRELMTVTGYWQKCVEEGLAQAILVTGPPGMGKSRLGRELVREVWSRPDEVALWLGQGDAMSSGTPLGLLGQLVRHAAQLHEGEPAAVRQGKLREAVARLAIEEAELATAFLGELAGVPAAAGASDPPQLQAARHHAALMGEHVRRAFGEFLGKTCDRGPTVLLIDDLQWADGPSVQALDAALRDLKERPLLVLALARPEVSERHPRLWMERGLHHLRLGELPRRAGERLARQVLGPGVGAEVIQKVVEQGQGNAFFLEESIRAAAEGRGGRLPETVLAMLAVRLGGLDAAARRTIRAASVFGEVFWGGGLEALLGGAARGEVILVEAAQGEIARGDTGRAEIARGEMGRGDVERWLQHLVDRELVVRRKESRLAGQEEYAFRHALVREAAYTMLTPTDRVLGHRLAAQWLEAAGEPDAAVIARHHEWGGERGRAAVAYERAAAQALKLGDCDTAFALGEQAVACGAAGELLGEVRLILQEAHYWRADFAASLRDGAEALGLLTRGGPGWFRAMAMALEAAYMSGDVPRLPGLVEEFSRASAEDELAWHWQVHGQATAVIALVRGGQVKAASPLARELERTLAERAAGVVSAGIAGRVHEALGRYLDGLGEPSRAWAALGRAGEAYQATGDERAALAARLLAATALLWMGVQAEAEAELGACVDAAERLGLPLLQGWAQSYLMEALGRRGALAEVQARWGALMAHMEVFGNPQFLALTQVALARSLLLAGQAEAAERAAREAIELCQEPSPWRCVCLTVLAQVLLERGQAPEALGWVREAMTFVEVQGGCTKGIEPELRLAYAEALWATGDEAGARAAIGVARTRLLLRAATIEEAAWRRAFLEDVRAHVRTLALAQAWLGVPDPLPDPVP